MRTLIIILTFIANFAFGQDKIIIDQNTVQYEIKDEFNRFDDVANDLKHFKSLAIEVNEDSSIKILNRYSSGFTAHTVTITIDKDLRLIEADYYYWTDVMDAKRPVYKVDGIKLSLNQNPFKKREGLRGQYEMYLKKVDADGALLEQSTFKGKFKSFQGIDRASPDYQWALEQNKIFYGITNENGIYLRPDRMPSLKSDIRILLEKIKQLKAHKPKSLRVFVVINENGRIENEPFRFLGNLGHSNAELQAQIKQLLIELTEWYPACVNEKSVKSQIPITLAIE